MVAISFIDTVYPQFSSQNWQNGISIFRSGGITRFQVYGELFNGRIRAGIGEVYEVRMKLHGQGKVVQWMECTCPPNRRRGEKCAHIASFCIYLDQEQASVLLKMNIDAGHSDEYLSTITTKPPTPTDSEASSPAFDFHEKMKLINEGRSLIENSGVENIFASQSTEVLSIVSDAEKPWLNVTVRIIGEKKLTYRFGIDDTCKLLFNSNYTKHASKEVLHMIEHGVVAKRFFDVKKEAGLTLVVQRAIAFYKDQKELKKIYSSQFDQIQLGRLGLFINEFGYVIFDDGMSINQSMRWNEYPKIATIDGDAAASLIETQFARLKETADVLLDEGLANIKIFSKSYVPEFSLNQSQEGSILVDAQVSSKQENGEDASTSVGSILDILKARAEGRKYLQTKNGIVKVTKEFDWLKNNLQEDGQIKLSTIEFIRFHEQFKDESHINNQSDVINKIRQGLISRDNLETPRLGNTHLELRPYQEEGLKWLWWLYSNQLGGLLADEMGLGKTHQAMALMAAIAENESASLFLVVCPTSVIDHWLDKIKRFTPALECFCYHGVFRRSLIDSIKPGARQVFVTSYGILLRDIEILMQKKWSLVVLDEAHLVKNHSTRTYKAACRLKSSMRLCLTGTPLENDLLELKNLFDYIAPNYLGTDSEFKKKYILAKSVQRDPIGDMELHRLIHPFKMRRNKLEVLTDLPEKVEDVRHCHLNIDQKQLYQETLNLKGARLINELKDEKNPVSFVHVFSLISLLKQICNDPALINPQYEGMGSGKLDLFDELLNEALESDQKVVVFSQYAKMIYRLSERLKKKQIRHVILTGQTVRRGEVVRTFQEDTGVKVFLGSLLAGGTGIDLTAGNVVIHFDRWWNAAKENQATDRIHRIGQVKNVQVYKLVTRGTLEERIDEIISKKKMIFERFVEQDEEILKHLTREDLLQLLKAPAEVENIDLREEVSFETYDH